MIILFFTKIENEKMSEPFNFIREGHYLQQIYFFQNG